jgi:putative endonuclease
LVQALSELVTRMGSWLHILLCADGSYYVGTTRDSLDRRFAEHQAGTFGGYTSRRPPVTLVYHQAFERITDAIAAERQIKGWRREKKEALIRGDFQLLSALSRRNHRIEAAKDALRPTSS